MSEFASKIAGKIAIVAALEREVRPLVKGWHAREVLHEHKSFRVFANNGVAVVCGGIGPEAARRAAEAIIAVVEPAIIFSVGFAGALDSSLKVGDIVRPARVINARDGSSVRLEDGRGVLVSVNSVASPEQKVKLRESYGAQIVDMEAAAVAQAADLHGVQFAVIKAISDEVGFRFPSTEKFVDSNGKFSEGRFALFAASRPWLWRSVFQLARNSSRASRALCEALQQAVSGEII
jgi:adenosylhomocysteine nucleosidase